MLEEDFLFLVAEVAARLRDYGVKCGTSETIDAYRALGLVRMERVEELRNVMKLCMIKRLEDYEIFDRVFEELTTPRRQKPERRQGEAGGDGEGVQRTLQRGRESGKDSRQAMLAYYSPVEILSKKDLPVPTLEFIRESRRVMKRLRRRLALLPGRRYEKSLKGVVDFGETIRQSLRNYGEVMRVLRMRRKLTRCKLVAIFDVSGSMDTYTEFLMQSMYSLARQSVAVEVFVFSTKLMRVSSLLKYFGPKKAADLISRDVNIWGSGTRIGSCLLNFIEKYRGMVGRGTVLIIVSDGWDTGEPELLDTAMRILKGMVGRLIWVNPHADKPGFKPRTIGMETALPYVDILAGINA
ncbi:MAG: VWA domain-containing protein, partial [Candidatus Caldarchaeum sp.]|nr:VWA domain-containing protein [Candidatus Caldarchaeum sp.]